MDTKGSYTSHLHMCTIVSNFWSHCKTLTERSCQMLNTMLLRKMLPNEDSITQNGANMPETTGGVLVHPVSR
jgi:hypothetical protein